MPHGAELLLLLTIGMPLMVILAVILLVKAVSSRQKG